jgi:hypothetical protein
MNLLIILITLLTSNIEVAHSVNLCKRCKFFLPGDYCSKFPKEHKINIVTGDESKIVNLHKVYYCSTAREFEDLCGYKGKFFIDKERDAILMEELKIVIGDLWD